MEDEDQFFEYLYFLRNFIPNPRTVEILFVLLCSNLLFEPFGQDNTLEMFNLFSQKTLVLKDKEGKPSF